MKTVTVRLVLLLIALAGLTFEGRAAEAKAANPGRTEARAGKVDVNTADAATLEELPGVGPQTAQAIIAERPFASVSDLERVRGIGPEKMRELRGRVTASAPRAARPRVTATDERGGRVARSAQERPSHTASNGSRVNLNTASRAELEALPEIGPVKAQAIIDGRPYRNPEDVMRVSGIKEKTFEAIQDQITVR